MKESKNYELIVSHLIEGESKYDGYAQDEAGSERAFRLFLSEKKNYLTEKVILNEFGKNKTLAEIFLFDKYRFFPGTNVKKGNKTIKIWYDTKGIEPIKFGDEFFDYFFALKFRHLELLEIDNYLKYHLENSFGGKKTEFSRYVNLAIRTYEEDILHDKIVKTIEEWIGYNKVVANAETFKENVIKRNPGNKLTSLTLVQTALLIDYMQQCNIFLKDLDYIEVGRAFNILTGYSTNTVRQNIGQKGVQGIRNEDYKELYDKLIKIANLIKPNIREK